MARGLQLGLKEQKPRILADVGDVQAKAQDRCDSRGHGEGGPLKGGPCREALRVLSSCWRVQGRLGEGRMGEGREVERKRGEGRRRKGE